MVRNTEISTKGVDSITVNLQQGQELVSRKLQETVSKIEELSACLVALSSKVENIAYNQSQLDNSIPSAKPPSHPPPPSTSTAEATNWLNNNITTGVIDEYRDRENRKLNLILYNVPESQSGKTSVQKAHDTNFISDIANKIEAGQVDVTNVTRLGKKVNNKNRLMKVQVASLSQKRRLLMNAKKLKQCSGDFQNIYLTPDLSYNERQANRLLRQELSHRKEAGETDLVIYRGSIMKRPLHKSNVATSHDMDTSHWVQQDPQSG